MSGLSLAGCVLVADALHASAWRANLIGILTGVLSGLAYAGYSLMGRAAARRGLDPWTTLLYIFGFATVLLFLCNLPPGGPLPGSAARPADLLWLEMLAPVPETELAARLRAFGVQAAPGARFFPEPAPATCLRLSIATLDEAEIRTGMARLGRALRAPR